MAATFIAVRTKKRQLEALREWRTRRLGAFAKWIFPIIRSAHPADLMEQLVSVQPMQEPVGRTFGKDLAQPGADRTVLWEAKP